MDGEQKQFLKCVACQKWTLHKWSGDLDRWLCIAHNCEKDGNKRFGQIVRSYSRRSDGQVMETVFIVQTLHIGSGPDTRDRPIRKWIPLETRPCTDPDIVRQFDKPCVPQTPAGRVSEDWMRAMPYYVRFGELSVHFRGREDNGAISNSDA